MSVGGHAGAGLVFVSQSILYIAFSAITVYITTKCSVVENERDEQQEV